MTRTFLIWQVLPAACCWLPAATHLLSSSPPIILLLHLTAATRAAACCPRRARYDAGRREKKQQVFDDFQCAARELARLGYTRPERLAIQGGSNGGLLVGNMLVRDLSRLATINVCRRVWLAVLCCAESVSQRSL